MGVPCTKCGALDAMVRATRVALKWGALQRRIGAKPRLLAQQIKAADAPPRNL